MPALQIAEDRGLLVPQGQIVKTAYVRIEDVVMACRDRMAVGDVDAAMKRLMAAAPGQPWPCPVGEWSGNRFHLHDGRHQFIAAQMLGHSHILVAWIEELK